MTANVHQNWVQTLLRHRNRRYFPVSSGSVPADLVAERVSAQNTNLTYLLESMGSLPTFSAEGDSDAHLRDTALWLVQTRMLDFVKHAMDNGLPREALAGIVSATSPRYTRLFASVLEWLSSNNKDIDRRSSQLRSMILAHDL
jgi:hypothetical protein